MDLLYCPPNLVLLCVHVIVTHLHCAAAARSQLTSLFPVLSQAYPECLLPLSTVCLEPGQCHFYHDLCLFSALLASQPLLILHNWTLPAHPGLNGFTLDPVSRLYCLSTVPIAPQIPQTCTPHSPDPFFCLCPIPCLTWLCGVGFHPHTEPGTTWGPARLQESPFSWGGRTWDSLAS